MGISGAGVWAKEDSSKFLISSFFLFMRKFLTSIVAFFIPISLVPNKACSRP